MCEENDRKVLLNYTYMLSSLPPHPPSTLGTRKSNRIASCVWDRFALLGLRDDPNVRCKCNQCGVDYACDSKFGTSTLGNHFTNNCKTYSGILQDKKQKIISFENREDGNGINLIDIGHSKEEARVAYANMITVDELSFRFVETHESRLFCSVKINLIIIELHYLKLIGIL